MRKFIYSPAPRAVAAGLSVFICPPDSWLCRGTAFVSVSSMRGREPLRAEVSHLTRVVGPAVDSCTSGAEIRRGLIFLRRLGTGWAAVDRAGYHLGDSVATKRGQCACVFSTGRGSQPWYHLNSTSCRWPVLPLLCPWRHSGGSQ